MANADDKLVVFFADHTANAVVSASPKRPRSGGLPLRPLLAYVGDAQTSLTAIRASLLHHAEEPDHLPARGHGPVTLTRALDHGCAAPPKRMSVAPGGGSLEISAPRAPLSIQANTTHQSRSCKAFRGAQKLGSAWL